MPITLNNYSFTNATYTVTEGLNLDGSIGTATITLSPVSGYTITASDFSLESNYQNEYVNLVSFTQSGDNVICNIVFHLNAVMPSNNLTIPLCIKGAGVLSLRTIAGTYDALVGANVTPVGETGTVYSGSGAEGSNLNLFTKTYTCDSGFEFNESTGFPTAQIITGNQANYNITQTPVYNAGGGITSLAFVVNYTFPSENISGDKIRFIAPRALTVYVPVIKVTSYSVDTSTILSTGENRAIVVFGAEGADFTLNMTDSQSNSYVIEPAGVIPASGQTSVMIPFPDASALSANQVTYTLTLAGDLISPFPQVNPIIFTQLINKPKVRLLGSSSSGFISGFTTVEASGNAYSEPTETYLQGESTLVVSSPKTLTYSGFEREDIPLTQRVGANTTVTSAVSNSATFNVTDATGLLANDEFTVNVSSLQEGYAPFEFKITNVNGNQLTVTPNITVSQGTPLFIFRQKGNCLDEVEIATITQVNPQTVKMNYKVPIKRFGNNDFDFTVELDNVFDVVNPTVLTQVALGYNSNIKLSTTACCGSTINRFLNAATLALATTIHDDANGNTLSAAGVYADYSGYRYWSGTAFTSTAQACPTCYTELTLCFNSVSASNVCCTTATEVTRYVAAGQTFQNNTGMYNNTGLTVAATDGYYSENSNVCSPNNGGGPLP